MSHSTSTVNQTKNNENLRSRILEPDTITKDKRSYSRTSFNPNTRPLFTSVCGTKTRKDREEIHNRSTSTQPPHVRSTRQIRTIEGHYTTDSTKRLDGKHRSDRRILPCTGERIITVCSKIQESVKNLRIHFSSNGSKHLPSHLHQTYASTAKHPATERYSAHRISGRPTNCWQIPRRNKTTCENGARSATTIRSHRKHKEIRTNSSSTNQISGHDSRFSISINNSSSMDSCSLVASSSKPYRQGFILNPRILSPPSSSPPVQHDSPPSQLEINRSDFIRKKLMEQYSQDVVDLLMERLRSKTVASYDSGWKTFAKFINSNTINIDESKEGFCATIIRALLRYMAHAHAQNHSYGQVANIIAAVSNVTELAYGTNINESNALLKQAKLSYQRQHPSASKYDESYDSDDVFTLIDSWSDNENLSLEKLRAKVIALLKLDLCARGSDLVAIRRHPQCLKFDSHDNLQIRYFEPKGSRYGGFSKWITIYKYNFSRRLCTVRAVQDYLARTEPLADNQSPIRSCKSIILSLPSTTRVPFSLTSDTINNIMVEVLREAGIDTVKFHGHSTRMASVTKALYAGISLDNVMFQANMKTKDTFIKHYVRAPLPHKLLEIPFSHGIRYSFQ